MDLTFSDMRQYSPFLSQHHSEMRLYYVFLLHHQSEIKLYYTFQPYTFKRDKGILGTEIMHRLWDKTKNSSKYSIQDNNLKKIR